MTTRSTPPALVGAESVLREIARAPDELSGELLGQLVEVVRPARGTDAEEAAARFEGLLAVLDAHPALTAALAAHVSAVLRSKMHRTLYAESGVLTSAGFFTGLWSRLLGGLLPPAIDADFLRDLVAEVFDEPQDGEWVVALPREHWLELLEKLGCFGDSFADVRAHIRHELLEAMRMTSYRLAALGMEPALLLYAPALARHESPFLSQSDEVRLFLTTHADPAVPVPHDGHLEILLGHCTTFVASIRTKSRETGVGVDLVFLLARMEQLVERLLVLRQLAVPDAATGDEEKRARAVLFMVRLIRAENRRNRFGELFEGTTQLLARRVTEHASKSGERYVSTTRGEYGEMFRAAAGAGLIVAVMALLKILVSTLGLPDFWRAVTLSLIYGIGFVIAHILHFTIATKQPAMTAATLAAALDGAADRETRLERLVTIAAQVSRTQWVSIAGNVSIGFLTSLAIVFFAGAVLGWEPVTVEKGQRLLHELHPWRSLALVHAAIAGVYLFLSGLISGYYDNQSLLHRIPERLRRVKWMRRIFGEARTDRVAVYVEHNLGALMANFLFGCMLGSTATLGEFFGLPLDIRHVSFAAANFAYGLQALDFSTGWPVVVISVAGIVLIGVVNLVVSFYLALNVALRSRGITPEDTDGLTRRVLRRFRESPREFLFPPRS